jgi:hypothetical protein
VSSFMRAMKFGLLARTGRVTQIRGGNRIGPRNQPQLEVNHWVIRSKSVYLTRTLPKVGIFQKVIVVEGNVRFIKVP